MLLLMLLLLHDPGVMLMVKHFRALTNGLAVLDTCHAGRIFQAASDRFEDKC